MTVRVRDMEFIKLAVWTDGVGHEWERPTEEALVSGTALSLSTFDG